MNPLYIHSQLTPSAFFFSAAKDSQYVVFSFIARSYQSGFYNHGRRPNYAMGTDDQNIFFRPHYPLCVTSILTPYAYNMTHGSDTSKSDVFYSSSSSSDSALGASSKVCLYL